MVPPKATFHSQEYKDKRYTDLEQLAKEAQSMLKHTFSRSLMHVLITTSGYT